MSLPVLLPCEPFDQLAPLRLEAPRLLELGEGGEFLPYDPSGPWGIYDGAGNSVDGTVDLQGFRLQRVGQPESLGRPRSAGLPRAPGGRYLYGGLLKFHYGHFIVNSLSRLWPLIGADRPATKVVFHGLGTVEAWFRQPFIASIFTALGLSRDDVVTFTEPTWIEELVVAYPSFQERQHVHRAFGELGAAIGRGVLGTNRVESVGRPVYFSKTRLAGGVGRVVNEWVIEERLRQAGVEIAYPETMPFPDQVRLFAERPTIMGFASSAFHTGLFRPPVGRVICIAPQKQPNPNFYLMDLAAGYSARYVRAEGTRKVDERPRVNQEGFLTEHKVANPEAIAEELIEMAKGK